MHRDDWPAKSKPAHLAVIWLCALAPVISPIGRPICRMNWKNWEKQNDRPVVPFTAGARYLSPAAKLAQHTWFGVGGPADILFCPLDENDLPLSGRLSGRYSGNRDGRWVNLLVRDGGVAGVVVKMNAHLTSIHHEAHKSLQRPVPLMPMLPAMHKRPVFLV